MTNYLKTNKWKILISALVTLVPVIVGVVLWNELPDPMPVHWGPSGEVDGWASKAFAVFGIYGILAGINILCHLATGLDRKNKDQNKKVFGLVFWLVPIISNLLGLICYLTALGVSVNAPNIVVAVLGVIFAIIGNYLPKCKLNYTIGIKIVWTLESNVNWVATHRFAGKVWLVCGIALALLAFLPAKALVWVSLAVLLIMAISPLIYSYVFFRRHEGDEGYFRVGVVDKEEE